MTGRKHGDGQADASLLFNVSALLREAIGSTREHEIADAPFHFNGVRTEVRGTLHLLRTDGSILAAGACALGVREICGACLDPFEAALDFRFEEEFWPEKDPVSRQPLHVPEGREGFPIVDSHIDLSEALRQYAEMARPLSPRCGAKCPGAAVAKPAAGAIDSRWDALQRLRDELES